MSLSFFRTRVMAGVTSSGALSVLYLVSRVSLFVSSLALPLLFVDSISSGLISLRFLSEYECQYQPSRLVSSSYTVIDSNTFPL